MKKREFNTSEIQRDTKVSFSSLIPNSNWAHRNRSVPLNSDDFFVTIIRRKLDWNPVIKKSLETNAVYQKPKQSIGSVVGTVGLGRSLEAIPPLGFLHIKGGKGANQSSRSTSRALAAYIKLWNRTFFFLINV